MVEAWTCELVQALNDIATAGLTPDITLLIDIPPEIGLARADSGSNQHKDAIGQESRNVPPTRPRRLSATGQAGTAADRVLDGALPASEVTRRRLEAPRWPRHSYQISVSRRWTGTGLGHYHDLAANVQEVELATRSAAKAHRQSVKRRIRNRAVKSATKTALKRAGESIVGGDMDAARDSVRAAIQTLDRAAQKGVLHPNNAGRRKSRLLLKYNAAVAALQAGGGAEAAPKAKSAAKKTAKPAARKAKPAARKAKK